MCHRSPAHLPIHLLSVVQPGKQPCLLVCYGDSLCSYLLKPPLVSKFPVSLEHGDESARFLVLKSTVCVVCLCSHVCVLVHTGTYTHVCTWKPEITIECLPLLLSTFIFIYVSETGLSLNLKLTSWARVGIQSRDTLFCTFPLLELQVHWNLFALVSISLSRGMRC